MTEQSTQSAGGTLQPDFNYLVQTFFIQAMINAGKIPNPMTQKQDTHKQMAQFHIGLLELIEQKTKGNLSTEEQKVLANCLNQARMAFLELKA